MAARDSAHGGGILDGIRIVDLSDGIAGPVATLMLAEAGADVVAVEGTRRRDQPLHARVPHVDAQQAQRRPSTSTPPTTAPRSTDFSPRPTSSCTTTVRRAPAALGLDDETLATRFPQLIVSSVLAWPANHADADLPVDELLTMARLGVLDEQQGFRDGPIYLRCPIASWCASHLAAIGIVARLITRQRTGHAGPAHTSLAQGALVPMAMHWRRVERPSQSLAVGMPKGQTGATLFETGDGVWIHLMGDPTKSPMFTDAIAVVRPDGPRQDPGTLFQQTDGWSEALLLHPSSAWLESFWANDVPVQPAAPLGAIFGDEQARTNGYVIEVDHPELGTIAMAGSPVTVDPPTHMRSSRLRSVHTPTRCWPSGEPRHAPRRDRTRARVSALEGVKVVDAGAFLAGPLGPMLLTDLGADVVKVEPPGGEGMRWVEWSFFGCQRGKRGVALDLKSPDGTARARRAARDGPTSSTTTCGCRRRAGSASTRRRCGRSTPTSSTATPARTDRRAREPTGPATTSCSRRRAAGRSPAPARATCRCGTGFGFMDHLCAMGVGDRHAARARTTATARATTQVVAGSLLGGGVMTGSETYLDRRREIVAMPVLDHEQTGIARRRTASPSSPTAGSPWPPPPTRSSPRCDGPSAGVDAPVASHRRDDALAALADRGRAVQQVRLDQGDRSSRPPTTTPPGLIARYRAHRLRATVEQPGAFWSSAIST